MKLIVAAHQYLQEYPYPAPAVLRALGSWANNFLLGKENELPYLEIESIANHYGEHQDYVFEAMSDELTTAMWSIERALLPYQSQYRGEVQRLTLTHQWPRCRFVVADSQHLLLILEGINGY